MAMGSSFIWKQSVTAAMHHHNHIHVHVVQAPNMEYVMEPTSSPSPQLYSIPTYYLLPNNAVHTHTEFNYFAV